jgi:serine/threonine protein kinase
MDAGDTGASTWLHNRMPKTKQADIFCLGAIFYKALTGRVPVLKGNSITPHKLFKKQPKAIQQLIRRMLSQEPDKRFQRIDQVIEAMDQIQDKNKVKGAPDHTLTFAADQAPWSPERGTAFFSRRGIKRALLALSVFLLFLAAGGTFLLMSGRGSESLEIVHQAWQKMVTLLSSSQP